MAVNIGPRIGIEGEAEYRRQINSIISTSKTLASDMKALTSAFDKNGKSLEQNAQQHKLLQEQIDNQKSKVSTMTSMLDKAKAKYEENRRQLELQKEALTDNSAEVERLEKAVAQSESVMQRWQQNVNNATAELNTMQNQLKEMPSSLDLIASKISTLGSKFQTLGDSLSNIGTKMTSALTTPIVGAFGASAKAAVDWESAFTGVMKTVDETANTTYQDLKENINEIAKTTASSQNEIAATMEIAGQLGVSADNITEFTKTMVMLGDTTNLTSEEAASAIAKFANVTKMPLTEVDKLGSAIVDLGNNFATTEADIVEMATRLSGAGAQIGLTQGEILGFATALSSVGIEAEMGGSAFSKAMIKMQVAAESGASGFDKLMEQLVALGHDDLAGASFREMQVWLSNDSKALKNVANETGHTKEEIQALIESRANLENFAEVAGMTAEEFVKAYQDDAPAALQAFIQGLGDTESKGESTIQMLQDMGFTEVRLRDTLTRLAQSGELVTNAVAKGNEAFSENTAMAAEAEKRYATMEAKISQLKSSITEVAVSFGESLMPSITKAVEKLGEFAEALSSLDESEREQIIKIAAIVAAIGPLLVAGGKLLAGIGKIMAFAPQISTALQGITTLFKGFQITTMGALAPILAIAAGIAVLVGAFITLWNTNEQFRTNMTEIWNYIQEAFSNFIAQIQEMLPAIQEGFSNLISVIQPLWEGFCAILAPIFEGAFEMIAVIIQKFLDLITSIIQVITGIFTLNGQMFLTGLTNFFLTIISFLGQEFMLIFTMIRNIINVILGFFGTSLEQIWTTLKTAFSNFLTTVTEKMVEIRDIVFEKFGEVVDFFESLPERFYNWGVEMIQNLIDGILSMVDAVGETISNVAETIASFLHFSEPDRGPLSSFNSWMPDMMKQMAEQIEKGRYKVQLAAGHVAADIAAPIGTTQTFTLNNSFTFNGGYSEADGRTIARQINRQLGALYI